jgi:hypothetical protein
MNEDLINLSRICNRGIEMFLAREDSIAVDMFAVMKIEVERLITNNVLTSDPLGYGFFPMKVNWKYEEMEPDDGCSPATWRIFREDDPSIEATICELWSGENDSKAICEEICASHNHLVKNEQTPDVLVLEPSKVELMMERTSDGKWRCLNATSGAV